MYTIQQPTENTYKQAIKLLRAGEIIAVPTETVYGLAVDATNTDAVKKLFTLKGRPADKALSIQVATKQQITDYATITDPLEQQLIDQYMPGPLTIVLQKKEIISAIVTANQSTVGVRIPDHPVMQALLAECHFPLAVPSANPSDEKPATTAQEVYDYFGDMIPLIIDGGQNTDHIASTVIKVENGKIAILRQGKILL